MSHLPPHPPQVAWQLGPRHQQVEISTLLRCPLNRAQEEERPRIVKPYCLSIEWGSLICQQLEDSRHILLVKPSRCPAQSQAHSRNPRPAMGRRGSTDHTQTHRLWVLVSLCPFPHGLTTASDSGAQSWLPLAGTRRGKGGTCSTLLLLPLPWRLVPQASW